MINLFYGPVVNPKTFVTLVTCTSTRPPPTPILSMNIDHECPKWYIEESPEQSIWGTIKLIEHVQSLPPSHSGEQLVHPTVTPRFLLACSDTLLDELRELVKWYPDIVTQTHISESRKEIEAMLTRFGTDSYAAIYDSHGLLRDDTILTHGVLLTEKEMDLLSKCVTGVAHCPSSNFYLESGMARVGSMFGHSVKVGIGTDVSGGYNPSMLCAIQMASTAFKMVTIQAELDKCWYKCCKHHEHEKHSRHECNVTDTPDLRGAPKEEEARVGVAQRVAPRGRSEARGPHHEHNHNNRDHDDNDDDGHGYHCHPKPDPDPTHFTNQQLHTATLCGASVCSLSACIRLFVPSKAFDALHISLDDACWNPAVWGWTWGAEERGATPGSVKNWMERFLFGGDRGNMRRMWVQGEVVGSVDGGKRWHGDANGEGREGERGIRRTKRGEAGGGGCHYRI